jgi:hypothetical protein
MGTIAANVTLIQPWYTGAIGLIAGAIFGAIIAGGITLYRDSQNDKKQKRDAQIRAISNLRGRKHTMLQSKASYYSAFFESLNLSASAKIISTRYIDYDSIRSLRESKIPGEMEKAQQYVNEKIDSSLRKSLEMKEGLRQKQRYEELQQEMAKNDERFWVTIGHIKTLFPNKRVEELIKTIKNADEELGKLEKEYTEGIEPIRNEINTNPGLIESNLDRKNWVKRILESLDDWVNSQYPTLRSKVDNFDSKIDNLLNYLENELKNPQYCRNCRLFCSDKICPLSPKLHPLDSHE